MIRAEEEERMKLPLSIYRVHSVDMRLSGTSGEEREKPGRDRLVADESSRIVESNNGMLGGE